MVPRQSLPTRSSFQPLHLNKHCETKRDIGNVFCWGSRQQTLVVTLAMVDSQGATKDDNPRRANWSGEEIRILVNRQLQFPFFPFSKHIVDPNSPSQLLQWNLRWLCNYYFTDQFQLVKGKTNNRIKFRLASNWQRRWHLTLLLPPNCPPSMAVESSVCSFILENNFMSTTRVCGIVEHFKCGHLQTIRPKCTH